MEPKIALGLIGRFALLCQLFANAISQNAGPVGPETTTLDWWGASTADMRAETPAEFHPKFLPQAQAQQVLSQAGGLTATTPQGPGTRGPEVIEIHTPHGATERRVDPSGSSGGVPSQLSAAGPSPGPAAPASVPTPGAQAQQQQSDNKNGASTSAPWPTIMLLATVIIFSLL